MKNQIKFVSLVIGLLILFSFMLSSCVQTTVGVVSAEINKNGELILTYGDGTEQNVGTVVGKDGKNGANGKKGANGQNGVDGADGSLIITSDGSSISAASAKGLRSAVSIVCKFMANVSYGGWGPNSGSATTKEYASAGSGVIYRMDKAEGDAFIITNYHVVYDVSSNTENGISNDISVYLYGSEIKGKAIEATYVGGSLYYDIAVLRVEDSEVLKESSACAVEVADSDEVAVGNGAIAIGNAQGLGLSSTAGIVSVDSEYITMTAADGKTTVSFRVMRVDTAVNSGNSGGGLYDDSGNLIGIVNAKIVYDGVENIGYAIPSNVAVSIAENIMDYCYGTATQRVQRAVLGITVSASDSKAVYDSKTGKISIKETVSVHEILSGSLVDGVLQVNDVLVSATVNDQTVDITRQYHMIDLMLDVRVGDCITLNILRDGEEKTVSVTITQECLTEY